MWLKDYQSQALDAFESYWKQLQKMNEEICRLSEESTVISSRLNAPQMAWKELAPNPMNFVIRPDYINRQSARNESVPHICLKIPTGGGKTLIGAAALGRANIQTGLVLWITPSRAIYKQTWAAFANRMHPYRQYLERACGGRVKLLEKDDHFTQQDVENYLCIMPLMLQSAARKNETNFLRIFRDSGKYPSFFPEVDDFSGNQKLHEEFPDLEITDLADEHSGGVKQSLYNVLKLIRPFIVLDEAHNAYTPARRIKLCALNPRFMLELSATPESRVSNILTVVSGTDLKREEMIKLPLYVHNFNNADWKFVLAKSKEKLEELAAKAGELRARHNCYIRPLMLIRVERVGREQRDGEHIHAEDVREHLMQVLNIPAEHIRRKTAEKDEIADEDLMSEYSEVRYIITKDALREGWDCPFAYVLTLLDTTRTVRALTQMTGRILRQPYAKTCEIPELNNSHVYCLHNDVESSVQSVKKGLEEEGLADLGDYVYGGEIVGTSGNRGVPQPLKLTAKVREQYKNRRIFLPLVLHKQGKKYEPLKYECDILSAIDWQKIANMYVSASTGIPAHIHEIITSVNLGVKIKSRTHDVSEDVDKTVRLEFFVRQIADVIPNPWRAADIVQNALAVLRNEKGISDDKIFDGRYNLAETIKHQAAKVLEKESSAVFSKKLQTGDIIFELREKSEFEMPNEITKLVAEDEYRLTRHGQDMQKSRYSPIFAKEFNELEKKFAFHLDQHKAVQWWHRIVARKDYWVQGWKRNRIYLDFIVCVEQVANNKPRMLVLDTKGMQLIGNFDTEYKEAVFKKLEEISPSAMQCGEIKSKGQKIPLFLRIIPEDDYGNTFNGIVEE